MLRHNTYLLAFATILAACNADGPSADNDTSGYDGEFAGYTEAAGDDRSGEIRQQVVQSFQYGMPMAALDLPADWVLKQDRNTGNWGITGPEVSIHNTGLTMFQFSQDNNYNMTLQQNGQKVRGWMPVDQVFQQDIAPMMQAEGYTYVSNENSPAVAQANMRGLAPLYSALPTQKDAQVNISEWRSRSGSRLMVVAHESTFASEGFVNWGYFCTVLEASEAKFAQAKAALMHAMIHVHYNPQYFAAYNADEQQKAERSWAQHNARMRNNQANFEAQQRNFRANADATNDAIMNNWRSNNASSDRSHEAFIDNIRGEQNAVDPYSGGSFKIESGSNQYWMNQNGEYYGTDDVLNDPNVGNTSSDQWRQVEVE